MGADELDRDDAPTPTPDDLVGRVEAVGQLGIEGPDATLASDTLAAIADDAARLLDAGPVDDAP